MAIVTPAPTPIPSGDAWNTQVDSSSTQVTVTALLVVQDPDHPRLLDTYAALAAQDQQPQRLVIVDASADRSVRERIDNPDISVVVVPAGAPFAEIVDTAVAALPGPGEDLVVTRRPRDRARKRTVRVRDKREWLWLLHEDSAPSPGSLRALLREAARSERVGIAGCKVVEAERPGHLVNVGLNLTRTGRHVGAHVEGEPDQRQHDDRRDVLSVSSAGMLIRRDVYLTLGGFDPAFDGDGDGLDLCWRTHLLGFQVVVIPAARVHQQLVDGHRGTRADVDRPRPRSGRTLRRHRQVALARCSLLGLPFAALWVSLSSAFMALVMLILKRPRRALAEAAQATAPFGFVRILGARARFRGRGVTRRRHLDGLFTPASTAVGDSYDALRAALTPDPGDDPDRGLVSNERPRAVTRLVTNPGVWMTLLLAAVSAVQWRPLLGESSIRGAGQGLTGGELRPFAMDAEGVWRLWRDHWSGPGLGEINIEQPYLPVLSGLARVAELLPWVDDTSSAATIVAWILITATPLAGVSAYLAGRAATKAAWPRAAAGFVWAGLATVTTATAQGRLGPVMVHLLLPLVLAGVMTVARRTAGTPSTFSTVLAAAVMGAFAPTALLLTSVLALGVTVIGSGWARLRGLIVLVVPWALMAPWVLRVLEDPRALLGGPGGLTAAASAQPWQLALAHPGGAGSYVSWWTAPFLILGVLAFAMPAKGQARAWIGLGSATLLGLGAGLAAPHVTVTAIGGVARTPWSGVPLDLMAAALLGAALLAADGLLQPRHSTAKSSTRAAFSGLLAATIVGAGAVAGLAAWSNPVESLQAESPRVPGVASHLALGSRATRMLTLEAQPDGSVTYRLDGRELGAPAHDLDVPRWIDPLVDRAVKALISPTGSSAATMSGQLSDLAISFVGVTGEGDRTALNRSLAGIDRLSPMASSQESSRWRVQAPGQIDAAPVSRVAIKQGEDVVSVVASDDPNSRTTTQIPAGGPGRVLKVGQAPGWAAGADVKLGGAPLKRIEGAVPTYALPERGGTLEIAPALAHPAWRWAQAGALAGCIFLAVPFGNARSRREVW